LLAEAVAAAVLVAAVLVGIKLLQPLCQAELFMPLLLVLVVR
jgi:hypothetical protein